MYLVYDFHNKISWELYCIFFTDPSRRSCRTLFR